MLVLNCIIPRVCTNIYLSICQSVCLILLYPFIFLFDHLLVCFTASLLFLSVYRSVCPSVLFVCSSVGRSLKFAWPSLHIVLCLVVYPSGYLSVCVSVCVSVCLFARLSLSLLTYMSIYLPFFFFACLSICHSICYIEHVSYEIYLYLFLKHF